MTSTTGFGRGVRLLGVALLGAPLFAACTGTPLAPSHGAPVGTTECGGETRSLIDCANEVAYQGATVQGSLKVGTLANGHVGYEEKALRRVDEETERYLAMQSRLCRDYNACALDKDSYQKESRAVRERLNRIPELREGLAKASSDDDRQKALDALYRVAVPAEKRLEEVTVSLGVEAALPSGKVVQVRPGAAFPTDTHMVFAVQVSAESYVYIFQVSPEGGLVVLFPNDRIGTRNPLAPGAAARIPSGTASFRLNERDIGTERVYVAVSRHELPRVSDALARVNSGQVTTLAGDATLQAIGSVGAAGPSAGKPCARASAPPPSPVMAGGTASVSASATARYAMTPRPAGQPRPADSLAGTRGLELFDDGSGTGGCPRSRGLELTDGGDTGLPPATMVARTEPGDPIIVKVITFEHLTPQAFAARGGDR